MELVESSVVEPEGLKVSMVGAVELSSQEKLRQHVLRGHYPFDPHCLECQQGRGVSRAPRRSLRERILEVQVDFFFLGLVESKFKMILLRQVFSGLLGVTAVSENVQVTGSICVKFWLSLDCLKRWKDRQLISGQMLRTKSGLFCGDLVCQGSTL